MRTWEFRMAFSFQIFRVSVLTVYWHRDWHRVDFLVVEKNIPNDIKKQWEFIQASYNNFKSESHFPPPKIQTGGGKQRLLSQRIYFHPSNLLVLIFGKADSFIEVVPFYSWLSQASQFRLCASILLSISMVEYFIYFNGILFQWQSFSLITSIRWQ